jgi:hypothetical protein
MLRHLHFLAASLMLLAASLAAADPPKLVGPATASANQEVRLLVDGLAMPDLSGPDGLNRVVEWANKLTFRVDSPPDADAFVECEIPLSLAGKVKVRVTFSAPKSGIYVIVLHDGNSAQIATKRITVGPVVPQPDPPPGPGPTPVPVVSGKRIAILIHEASEQTPEMAQLIVTLRDGPTAAWLSTKGHRLLILDRTPKEAAGRWLSTVTTEAAKGVPRLVILDATTDAVLYSESFGGGNADTVTELVKRTGG